MGNIREDYKVKKENSKDNKSDRQEYNPLQYPFGLDEIELLREFRNEKRKDDKKIKDEKER